MANAARALRQRKYEARCKQEGICPSCRGPNDRPDKYHCSRCLEKHRAYQRKQRFLNPGTPKKGSHTCRLCGDKGHRPPTCHLNPENDFV